MNETPPDQSVLWAIDPSSKRFALSVRSLKGGLRHQSSADVDLGPTHPPASRLRRLHEVVTKHATLQLYQFGFPLLIATEPPMGSGRNPMLVHAYGVTLAALAEVVDQWTPQIIWLEVESAKWKKAVGLPHNCDADAYCAELRRRHPVSFDNHDEAAAFWIGEYAASRIEPQ